MSDVKGRVGSMQLSWKSVPHGRAGESEAELADGKRIRVVWRLDADGIWLETPEGIFGFDLEGERDDEGRMTYSVWERESAGEWSGISFRRSGEESILGAGAGKKKAVRVRAQMPGKMIRVLVKAGSKVEKDQPIAVMEAMKMENEIRAPQAGVVKEMKVSEGQTVETGADLAVIEPA